MPPSAFVPIAEEVGLIRQIGEWVLKTACREAVAWVDVIDPPPPISVNLSSKQFHDPKLVDELESALVETGLPPQRLYVEITETVAMKNADATVQEFRRLRALGVRAVIDDFGTGASALTSLQRFPVDALQLDSSFVADLGRTPEAMTIAQAVIGLAQGLMLKVVAEGVETREQLDRLRAMGCELAQGFLFARPMDAFKLRESLASRMSPAVAPAPLRSHPLS